MLSAASSTAEPLVALALPLPLPLPRPAGTIHRSGKQVGMQAGEHACTKQQASLRQPMTLHNLLALPNSKPLVPTHPAACPA